MNRRILYPCVLTVLALVTVPAFAEKEKTLAEFRAFAINMQGGPLSNTGVVEMGIWAWSTDADRDMLMNTLKEKGSDALLDALTSLKPLGYIRGVNTIGWSLYYAKETTLPDGTRRYVFATNRKLTFGEVSRQTRSSEYDFTLVQVHFPPGKDKGEGKLGAAVKVTFNQKTQQIELENYEAMPVQLRDVTMKVPK